MLELYHTDLAVCAAKVRLTLAEKHLDWTSRHIDLAKGEQFAPRYLELNPKAVVPTLVHDGRVVRESTIINEYLDDVFPAVPLRPADHAERAQMRLWTKQEDEIHQVVNTFMTAIAFRPMELAKSPEERRARAAKIADPARQERWSGLVADGLSSPYAAAAARRLLVLLAEMQAALADRAWLASPDFSLADIGFIPFLNALSWLGFADHWRDRFPAVERWAGQARARASFASGVANWAQPERIETLRRAADAQANAVGELLRGAEQAPSLPISGVI